MVEYSSSTETGKCIFCEIIAGRRATPGVFREDEHFMAFLTIYPSTEGHTVIVPKKHWGSDVLAMPDDLLQRFICVAKTVATLLTNHFADVGRVWLIMEGTGIDHAHIKLVPMHGTAHMKEGIWKQYLSNEEVFFENYPWYLNSADGPQADEGKIRALAEKLQWGEKLLTPPAPP